MPSSNEKGRRPTVPKFASFKPKATDVAGRVGETTTDRARHAEHHITSTRDSQVRRHRSVERDAVPPSPSRLSRHLQPPPERRLDGGAVYCLDKRGDSLIVRYGSNDRNRIPEYRRIGGNRVLGADGFMRIEKLGSRQEFHMRNYHDGSNALLSSDRKSLLTRGIRLDSQPVRVRRMTPETGIFTDDCILLKTSRKRKRDGNLSENSSGDEEPSYKSIHGKSKRHEHSDSDEDFDSDASESLLNRSISDPITIRSIELSRKVREHPEDVDSWLELVDHQDILLDLQSGSRAPTAAELKSFADIKLSLLEQALQHNGDERRRERLNLQIIKEGIRVWDFKVAVKRITETMQKHPDSFELWKLHVSFLQTTLPAFRYDEIKQLYTDKLQSLGKQLLNVSAVENKIECSGQIIYVFLRLTRFLADAGFAELASAAWQATLELNLARPPTAPQTEWGLPPSFQEYWESEVPRFGEDGWRGWATFMTDGTAQEPPDPKTSNPLAPPTTRDPYRVWHAVEHHRSQNATVPARMLDEGAEDDPFRLVMFADIQGLLLYFPTEVLPHLRPHLLDAFLIFCRLPPGLRYGPMVDMNDSFLLRSPQGDPFTQLSSRNHADLSGDEQNKSPEFSYEIQQMYLTPEVLFFPTKWFRYFDQIHGRIPSGNYQWIATTLKQLTRVVGIKELGCYALAFESINEPGNEKKTAKAFLKQDPFNVDLYLGYSILEHEKQNKAAARNVLSAALNLPSMPPLDRIQLHIRAAWLELDDRDLAKAVLQLCLLVEDGPMSDNPQIPDSVEATPSQILKARQFLVTNRDYKISSGNMAEAVLYAEGLVLLDYLTQRSGKETISQKQGDIWSGVTRITQLSEDLVSRGQQHSHFHEKFLQFAARLLYYHARNGTFRPGLLREQLTQYLSYFPSNTIFLSLYAWRQARLSIDDRVRSLLQDHVLTRANASLSSYVFAIAHELRTGNAHSTRAAFERALAADACAHHPELWIAYIRLCHARKELRGAPKSGLAKAVFYRAAQACPWAKDVWMEAFGTLGREMDSAELKSVYATMCEKGLRIHVDLDEFVEDWRREHKDPEREMGKRKKPREKDHIRPLNIGT